MLTIAAPRKRIPVIAAYTSGYVEELSQATLHIAWKTIKARIYRYNGQYFISEADLGAAEDLTTEWDAAEPLPDQNAAGETSTEEAEEEEVAMGTYAYARVRVGRAAGGWGDYGYLKYEVTAGSGGGSGVPGADGEDAFVYIAYASDDSGTDFTTTFNAALDYIAILATDTEIPTPVVTDFDGLWKNYKGADPFTLHISTDTPSAEDGADGDMWATYLGE